MYLAYNEASPSGLVWTVSRGRAKAGNSAGSFDKSSGYWRVGRVDRLLAHRLIWELLFGEIPDGMVVDHIDGNTRNNKADNLRCVELTVNNQNRTLQRDNSSGLSGVHFCGTTGRWVASWYEGDKRHSKSFSLLMFGESAEVFAGQYRVSKIEELNQNGSAYTSRHGK